MMENLVWIWSRLKSYLQWLKGSELEISNTVPKVAPETGSEAWIGEKLLEAYNATYGNGGEEKRGTQKPDSPTSTSQPSTLLSSSLIPKEKSEETLAQVNKCPDQENLGKEYQVNDMVFCYFVDVTGKLVSGLGVIEAVNLDNSYDVRMVADQGLAKLGVGDFRRAGRC